VLPADSNFHTQKRSDREAGVTRSPCRCGLGRGWGGVRGEEAALFPEAAVTAMCSGGGGSLASSGDDGRARQRRRGAGVIGVGWASSGQGGGDPRRSGRWRPDAVMSGGGGGECSRLQRPE
jgi:hypothetical protein